MQTVAETNRASAGDVAGAYKEGEQYVADQYAGAKRYGSELEALPKENYTYNLSRAAGGPVGRRPYLVGEKGPELMVPDQPGTIIPNHRLQMIVRRAIPRADGGRVEVIKGLDRGQVNLAGVSPTPYMEKRNQVSLAAAGRFRGAAANVGTVPGPESTRAEAIFKNHLLAGHGVKDAAGNPLPYQQQPAWLRDVFIQHAPTTMAELPDAIAAAGPAIDTPKHMYLFNNPETGPKARAQVLDNLTKQAAAQGTVLNPVIKQRVLNEPVTPVNVGRFKADYQPFVPPANAVSAPAVIPAPASREITGSAVSGLARPPSLAELGENAAQPFM
jgi:hypothetical protein